MEALSEYHNVYQLRPQEPLVLLSIACAYIAQVRDYRRWLSSHAADPCSRVVMASVLACVIAGPPVKTAAVGKDLARARGSQHSLCEPSGLMACWLTTGCTLCCLWPNVRGTTHLCSSRPCSSQQVVLMHLINQHTNQPGRVTVQAMTKKVADRNQAVLYGFAFMQAYQAARGAPQEAAFNLARAAHELNLLHVAEPLYEQALRWVSSFICCALPERYVVWLPP